MEEAALHQESSNVLTEIPRYAGDAPAALPRERIRIPFVNIALFLLTLITTTMAGVYSAGGQLSLTNAAATLRSLATGLPFSIPLMAILFAHEMGHYVTSRRHGVKSSLPYFIPAPPMFITGTFGAFIRMREVPR